MGLELNTSEFIRDYLITYGETNPYELYQAHRSENRNTSYQNIRNYIYWLHKLGLIERTKTEPSKSTNFQEKQFYKTVGAKLQDEAWRDPREALYGERKKAKIKQDKIESRRQVISSPSTHVRIFDIEGHEYVFERATPEEIKTSMKIDWDLDKRKYLHSYAKQLSEEVRLVKMDPLDYLEITPMPDTKGWPWEPSIRSIKKGLDEGSVFETPFILIDIKNKVVGQEGRHRALALSRYGDKEMPVAIVTKF